MGIWISLLLMILAENVSHLRSENDCFFETSPLSWKQVTCRNVTSTFFETFNVTLDRSHWLKCENCHLGSVRNTTFYFTKNNISYVTLVNSKITNIGDYAFSKFPLLKVLNLAVNYIAELRTDIFYGIHRLLQLDLSRNYLRILPEEVFKHLTHLDLLNLNANSIHFIHTNAFSRLRNLKYLYMNNNKLEKLDANVFKHLENLKILYLESNQIREVHPHAFTGCENLNFLYMNNNSISFLVQYNFKPLASLVDLQLRSNNLTEIQTSTFNGLKNLRFLYLGRNKLSVVRPYGLIGLNALDTLELIENKFEYFSLDYFRDMEKLRYVWLENNGMKNFTVNEQSDTQSSLRILDLMGNLLQRIDFELMHEKMPRLQAVWIGRNPWKCRFATNMHNYFSTANISLCMSESCDPKDIENFLEEICYVPSETPTESYTTEYPTEGAGDVHPYKSFLVYTLTMIHLFYK